MRSQSLHALIADTRAAMVPPGHCPSTVWQYEYAWRCFEAYAATRRTKVFSTALAAAVYGSRPPRNRDLDGQ